MERLPYIDEHARSVAGNREQVWRGLLRVVCKNPDDPTTVPIGFVLGPVTETKRLELRGRHWFSRYALVFELDELDPDHTRLRAQSWAEFPGPAGKVYRMLVISSGAHRIVVRALLSRIAAAS